MGGRHVLGSGALCLLLGVGFLGWILTGLAWTQEQTPAPGEVVVTTGPLTATGLPPTPTPTPEPFNPVTIDTALLTATGAIPTATPTPEPFDPVTITTAPLTATGQGGSQ